MPLVVLATAAAIIASQALISGAFSLTQQAIQLGYAPRLDIDRTSHQEMGQVYVPQVNWGAHDLHDPDRDRLRIVDRARGGLRHCRDADDGDHGQCCVVVATERWGWPIVASLVTGLFLVIDLAFFGANVLKIAHGGWLPLVIGWLLHH